ncbi:MAG: FprA family A-type flavoprotein [Bacteroidetes bacterium]|nr:FprA family A-type flavoprotein [Bacteroidota bacterium]
MNDTKILRVTDDVKWIGVLDPDLITFDVVMETKYGTTYNSYFINAEKKTIVETTKEKYWDTYLKKIKEVCDPSEIEYIIINHTEPDHSGNLKNLLSIAPKAVVVGSGNAIRYLRDLMGNEIPHLIVKNDDILDLGDKKIRFISAPNLHWPDTMYSYLMEDKVLFTCDSFGAHYCDERMYDTEVGNWDEAFKYYFNVIMKPYSKFMLKAIERIRPLDIEAICTGHGPLLTKTWKHWVDITEDYSKLATLVPGEHRVLIAYVSAYMNTAKLANKIAEGIKLAGNIVVDICDVENVSLGDLDERIARSNAIIVGCPIVNQNILLPIYTLFATINPIRDKGKLAGAFGSYGWSGEGAKIIESNLSNLKLNFFGESLFVKFTPHNEQLIKSLEYGQAFGEKMLEKK